MGLADLFKSKQSRASDLYEQAQRLYERRKYAQALPLYQKAAELGDKRAQNDYGYMLDNGLGTPADPAAALPWFEKSAAQDYRAAINNCGRAYREGIGVEKDEAKALGYYKQNAVHNDDTGRFWYAYMLYNGQGTEPDYPEAKRWFEELAKKGNAEAVYYIGMLYYKGLGVPQDFKKAFSYFLEAAEKKIRLALFRCGWMKQHGEGFNNPNLYAAVDYYRRAVELGDMPAAFNMGECYLELLKNASLREVESYAKGALQAFTQAVGMQGNEENMAQARRKLRRLYDQPRYRQNGIPDAFKTIISPQEALDWMRMAAKEDTDAAKAIPRLERYVKGLPEEVPDAPKADAPRAKAAKRRQNVQGSRHVAEPIPAGPCDDDYRAGVLARRAGQAQKAKELFGKAAAAGNTQAMAALARLSLEAPGTPDIDTAIRQYRAAAEQGLEAVQLPLARLLLYTPGLGDAEREEGFALLEKAAERDDHEAQYLCGNCLLEGRGTSLIQWKAGEWYRRAAKFGHPGARERFAWMCRNRMKELQPHDYQQELEWRREAKEWCAETAEQGLPRAQCEYGHIIKNTLVGKEEEALGWWMRAADAGDLPALKTCLRALEGWNGIEADPDIHAYWQQKQQQCSNESAAERTAG